MQLLYIFGPANFRQNFQAILLICALLPVSHSFLSLTTTAKFRQHPTSVCVTIHTTSLFHSSNINDMDTTRITEIKTSKAPTPVGPYSQAVKAGSTLYVSGNIPLDPKTGDIVGGGDVQAETRQVLSNLDAVLKEAGAAPQNVVRCTVFLVDLKDFTAVNEVYADYFKDCPVAPSRSCVQVAALPKGVLVEIDCIAVL